MIINFVLFVKMATICLKINHSVYVELSLVLFHKYVLVIYVKILALRLNIVCNARMTLYRIALGVLIISL